MNVAPLIPRVLPPPRPSLNFSRRAAVNRQQIVAGGAGGTGVMAAGAGI